MCLLFAINYTDDKFVFLTSYLGKKNKPVYKMFMYTEEGEALVTTNTIVKNNEAVPFVPKPFDDKLFLSQLNKIVQDPLNKFNNVKGEPIPYANNEYKSSINLEGFKESRVIDYTNVSKKIRYKAEAEMTTILVYIPALIIGLFKIDLKMKVMLKPANAIRATTAISPNRASGTASKLKPSAPNQ